MNPSTSASPAVPHPAMDFKRVQPEPLVQAAAAAPAPRPAAVPAPAAAPANNAGLTANLVENIPMHAPAQSAPQSQPAVSEDDELDHIMKDIGHELKQAERKTSKKRLSLFSRKSKPVLAHKPVPLSQPATAPALAAPVPAPLPVIPAAAAQTAPLPAAKAAPQKTSSATIGIIFMTILVTGALITAAIYSYK